MGPLSVPPGMEVIYDALGNPRIRKKHMHVVPPKGWTGTEVPPQMMLPKKFLSTDTGDARALTRNRDLQNFHHGFCALAGLVRAGYKVKYIRQLSIRAHQEGDFSNWRIRFLYGKKKDRKLVSLIFPRVDL